MKKTLTKTEFVAYLVRKHKGSKAAYGRAVDEVLAGITEQLAHGAEVRFIGFGAFVILKQKERQQRVINSDRVMTLPAHARPHFRAGSKLKQAVNPSTNR